MKLPLPRLILRHLWMWRILWRHVTNRWFIFRDAPIWVCAEFAVHEDSKDADVRELARLAIDELRLRISTIQREIERVTQP